MDIQKRKISASFCYALFFICCFLSNHCSARMNPMEAAVNPMAVLYVNASSTMKIPKNLFGIFFEEINHAGSGGIWSELVSNRGFEHLNLTAPNPIDPWLSIGVDTALAIATDNNSLFDRNKVALRVEVLCDQKGLNLCPDGGVGIYNPGFWGMNIDKGKTYRLVFYTKSDQNRDISVSLTSGDGVQTLVTRNITFKAKQVEKWVKIDVKLIATASNTAARLQLTSSNKGVFWIDQVSLMPTDTHKRHGFRKDLYSMLENLSPKFMRFPGGTFVQGNVEKNGFKWKESVGPGENRPGHYNDEWNYWTDDALGYYEFLLLADDLGASPIWVFNIGLGSDDLPIIKPEEIDLYVQDALDGIEFARGLKDSTWGSLRARMGHPEQFTMKYVSVGNENCNWDDKDHRGYYEDVIYPRFYTAIRKTYPDMKIISNCDGVAKPLKDPADLFDFHPYPGSYDEMYEKNTLFNNFNRTGPKVFVSEYAVWCKDCGKGNFHAALSEAAFLIGLERNSDIVELASYAPLFANVNKPDWTPDAIWFDTWQTFGTPSYWVQYMFKESNGATLLSSTLEANSSTKVVASAVISYDVTSQVQKLKIKVVNYGGESVNLRILISNLNNNINTSNSKMIILSSDDLADQNSFQEPNKVVPQNKMLDNPGSDMDVVLSPHSFISYDLLWPAGIIEFTFRFTTLLHFIRILQSYN